MVRRVFSTFVRPETEPNSDEVGTVGPPGIPKAIRPPHLLTGEHQWTSLLRCQPLVLRAAALDKPGKSSGSVGDLEQHAHALGEHECPEKTCDQVPPKYMPEGGPVTGFFTPSVNNLHEVNQQHDGRQHLRYPLRSCIEQHDRCHAQSQPAQRSSAGQQKNSRRGAVQKVRRQAHQNQRPDGAPQAALPGKGLSRCGSRRACWLARARGVHSLSA